MVTHRNRRKPFKLQLSHTLEGHTGEVHSVAWSPDGKLLASGADDKTVRLWNLTTSALLNGHTHSINCVAWSPDNKLLASGSSDKTVRLWDPTTGSLVHVLEGHTSTVRSVAWSHDGTLLASGSSTDSLSKDTEVRIWRTKTWEPLAVLTDLKGSCFAAWHPRLSRVVTTGQRPNDIFVWHLA